jgi:hypothetical protein
VENGGKLEGIIVWMPGLRASYSRRNDWEVERSRIAYSSQIRNGMGRLKCDDLGAELTPSGHEDNGRGYNRGMKAEGGENYFPFRP